MPQKKKGKKKPAYLLPLTFLMGLCLYSPAFAHQQVAVDTYNEDDARHVLGAKVDAPKLVRLTDTFHIGVEGSKNLNQTDFESGWEGYVKATWSGCLLNCK